MKLRNGFVSNSSSSSFVISADSEDVVISISTTLKELSKSVIRSKKELDEHFIDEYSYNGKLEDALEEDYVRKNYLKALDELDRGKVVFIGSISSDDYDSLSSLIYTQGLSNCSFSTEVNIIEGD